MSRKSRFVQKLVLIFLLIDILVCPFTFVGMVFFPQAISFLEPLVCPDDLQMQTVSERQSGSDGPYTLTKVFCIGSHKEVDITWKVLLIMVGFPALGVIVFLIAPSSSEEKEKGRITLNPGRN